MEIFISLQQVYRGLGTISVLISKLVPLSTGNLLVCSKSPLVIHQIRNDFVDMVHLTNLWIPNQCSLLSLLKVSFCAGCTDPSVHVYLSAGPVAHNL